ncbi:unnamed protein product [Toxocara canis]|uniref:RNA polymerase II-associated factor 1 homolog n=1 Tax=Toxocara canis TaxID=6265 RepID=A0A183U107_TOXCA|nr:unnamed protein product [Toxocara canis]
MMDEEGEQFVTYFLPTKETLDKRMLDTKDGKEFDPDYTFVLFLCLCGAWCWLSEMIRDVLLKGRLAFDMLTSSAHYSYEYYSVRDYNWLVRNKSTKGYEQDNFLFSFRDTGVYYNELETRVSLTRRKAKRSRQQTKLMVRNRAYDENELATQEDREHHLLRPYDEKDDDDDDEDDDEASEKESSEENEGEPNEDGEKRKKDSDASDNDEKKSEEGSTDNEEKVKESGTDEEESGTDDEKNSEKSDSSEND